MSKQCTKPKRKWDDSWFKDKVLLVQAQANGQILHEEELAFLTNPRTAEGQAHRFALGEFYLFYGSDALASKEKESLMQTVTLLKNDFKKEESRNIDREIALEKKIKQLENIFYKRDQSAQTKSQQLEPKLYDGNVIKNTSAIMIPDSEETLMFAEESRSKMLLKQQDPMVLEKKVNTTPVDYVVLSQLSYDFKKQFVPQTELSAEQAFWSQNSMNSSDPSSSCKPTKVEVPNELPKGNANVQHSNLNANSELLRVKCNGCMLSDNHDLCVLDFINDVNARFKSKSVKKIGNACPLTRITTTAEVPLRKPNAPESDTPKPVVTLVYSRKPRKSKTNVVQIVLWYLDFGCFKHMTVDRSQFTNFVNNFLGTVKFGNDHVAKILGYGDYQIGNVTISRIYYVEGLGHNLFSVGQFCDSNLEVAFRQHTCFIRNLEGVDLLTGS
ncbi:hypothetical protein Tco_0535323 [Tanacetum coccineum]